MGLLWASATSVYAQSDSASFNIKFLLGGDVTPPSTPVLLQANPISATQIDLNWSASTDDYLLQGYVVSRGTSTIATTTGTTFSDTSVSASSTYSYSVKAFDSSANYSSSSNSITVTTPDYPVVPPVVTTDEDTTTQGNIARIVTRDITVTPGLATASIAVETAFPVRLTVRWGRSTDYELGYSVSEYYATDHRTLLSDLEPGTTYSYQIVAETTFGLEAVVDAGQFTTLAASGSGVPANLSRFAATVSGEDVKLSWQLPNAEDIAFVRIVRSHLGFPQYPQNGAVAYQGQGSSFTDKAILAEYSPVYYTAFVYSSDGKVSSGAIALAQIKPAPTAPPDSAPPDTTQPGTNQPALPDVPDKIAEATSTVEEDRVTVDMRLPELAEVFILQEGHKYSFLDPVITLEAQASLVVQIPVAAVAHNLKSIIGTLLDPTNNQQSHAFLLRINEDGTAYEAVVPALQVAGESVLEVAIYDYEAYTVATYKTPINFVVPQSPEPTVLFPDIFFRPPVLMAGAGVVVAALSWWLGLWLRRRQDEDKV